MPVDPETKEVFTFVLQFFPWITAIVAVSIGGWAFTTWLRIKNGYPLESSWGMPIHPKKDQEAIERIRLLTNENAGLKGQVGRLEERIAVLERIATDPAERTAREIEQLRHG